MAQQQGMVAHWRDRAIQRSEGISDAWEVVKAYSARFAEWILFACMIANIIQMLPGVKVWPWMEATVMGIQVVTLDVAGFGLASMGAAARRAGNNAVAETAEKTGKWLIGLMIVTLLVVAIGVLFPTTQGAIDYIEKGLILVRVVMTVVYGHVMHALREAGIEHVNQMEDLRAENERLEKALSDEQQAAKKQVEQLEADHEATVADLQEQLEGAQAESEQLAKKLATVQESLRDTLQNGSSIQASMAEVIADRNEKDALIQRLNADLQTSKSTIMRLQQVETKTAKLQQDNQHFATRLEAANQQITDLTAKLERAKNKITDLQNANSVPASSGKNRTAKDNITPIDQARTKSRISHAEVVAFMTSHPELKRSEVAAQLGVSERKVYDAIAWQREQEQENAVVSQ